MNIRAADEQEFTAVRAFYHLLTDAMADAPYSPGWKKGIYPSDEDLQTALREQTLFLGTEDGEIVAVMVRNHACVEDYALANWQVEALPEEVTVLHMLGVHPSYRGKGLAKELVKWAIADAKKRGQKAIRLDVLTGNLPAERLYPALGFRWMGRFDVYYPDTGRTKYDLFEYVL
ncbi:MAG: GNAT family N-acetyltransferase [Oscillospiraceae bacterium]|nr:GNAT family N-acetyltransferase [Oscillospiraceae bacterium]